MKLCEYADNLYSLLGFFYMSYVIATFGFEHRHVLISTLYVVVEEESDYCVIYVAFGLCIVSKHIAVSERVTLCMMLMHYGYIVYHVV